MVSIEAAPRHEPAAEDFDPVPVTVAGRRVEAYTVLYDEAGKQWVFMGVSKRDDTKAVISRFNDDRVVPIEWLGTMTTNRPPR